MGLMHQPVGIACGHSACKACLEEMIAKSNYQATCPTCRHAIEPGQLNINIATRALISRIRVKCTNDGCEWVGQNQEKEKHRDTCPFMLMTCANGCIGVYRRNELDQHLAACPYQLVPCVFCNAGVPRFHLDTHVENCPEGPRLCPLQCGERLPR